MAFGPYAGVKNADDDVIGVFGVGPDAEAVGET